MFSSPTFIPPIQIQSPGRSSIIDNAFTYEHSRIQSTESFYMTLAQGGSDQPLICHMRPESPPMGVCAMDPDSTGTGGEDLQRLTWVLYHLRAFMISTTCSSLSHLHDHPLPIPLPHVASADRVCMFRLVLHHDQGSICIYQKEYVIV